MYGDADMLSLLFLGFFWLLIARGGCQETSTQPINETEEEHRSVTVATPTGLVLASGWYRLVSFPLQIRGSPGGVNIVNIFVEGNANSFCFQFPRPKPGYVPISEIRSLRTCEIDHKLNQAVYTVDPIKSNGSECCIFIRGGFGPENMMEVYQQVGGMSFAKAKVLLSLKSHPLFSPSFLREFCFESYTVFSNIDKIYFAISCQIYRSIEQSDFQLTVQDQHTSHRQTFLIAKSSKLGQVKELPYTLKLLATGFRFEIAQKFDVRIVLEVKESEGCSRANESTSTQQEKLSAMFESTALWILYVLSGEDKLQRGDIAVCTNTRHAYPFNEYLDKCCSLSLLLHSETSLNVQCHDPFVLFKIIQVLTIILTALLFSFWPLCITVVEETAADFEKLR